MLEIIHKREIKDNSKFDFWTVFTRGTINIGGLVANQGIYNRCVLEKPYFTTRLTIYQHSMLRRMIETVGMSEYGVLNLFSIIIQQAVVKVLLVRDKGTIHIQIW